MKKKPRRWWRYVLLGFFVLAVMLSLYARFVEPNWIQVTRHRIKDGFAKKPMLIAHLSDLHIRNFGFRERRILEILQKEKPDLILITGDWIVLQPDVALHRAFFAQLHAPLGVYAVRGNHDQQSNGEEFVGTEVKWLKDEVAVLPNGVEVVGLDDWTPSMLRFDKKFPPMPKTQDCIGLFHEPEAYDVIDSSCTLSLAGHTHGGQVRIPGIHPFWVPRGSGRFVEGWYQNGQTHLFVSRGLGTSLYPIRFLARPELALIAVGE